MFERLIDFVLLTMLVGTAIAIARQRNLLAAAMLTGIFSLLGAGWMLFLDAPDVAFTEAAVGAGISTILILATIAVTTTEEKPGPESPLALLVVGLTGAALIYATLDMPRFGDPNSPANRSELTRIYIESSETPQHAEPGEHAEFAEHGKSGDHAKSYAVGIQNTVTTVLASFRGYDTMGETAVIFTAGLGVVAILRGARRRRFVAPEDEAPRDEGGPE